MSRLEFSAPTKREAFARSNGVCECHLIPWLKRPKGCGVKLGPGNVFYEHIEPAAISNRNDLANAACICKTCWSEKTATFDLPLIASANRKRDRNRNIKSHFYRPMVGTKRSGIKLSMRPYVIQSTGEQGNPGGRGRDGQDRRYRCGHRFDYSAFGAS